MQNRANKAFTLIEILIASVVILVAILGFFSLFSRGTELVSSIRGNLIATYALEEQMELIRRTSFSDIVSNYSAPSNFSASGFTLLSNPTGTITVDYPFGSGSPNDKIIRVSATVSWVTTAGAVKNKTIATYVTEDGMGG